MTMMRHYRVDGWLERLHAAIEAWPDRDLEYGVHDCARFAASCLDAMTGAAASTGTSWTGRLASEYGDAATADELLAREGGLEAAVTARLGEPVAPLRARRGDVCLVPASPADGVALGVCVGGFVAALVAGRVAYVPLSAAIKAWPT